MSDVVNEIDRFLSNLPADVQIARKRSILLPYEAEIMELKRRGCTEAVILLFLEQKNIRVAQSTLNYFIRSR